MSRPRSAPRSTKSPSTKPPTVTDSPPVDPVYVRAELRVLTELRTHFPALSPDEAATFQSLHDEDACRGKGTNTRGNDTFRIAMSWARTFGAHAADPALDAPQVRWFLDCLTGLGTALSGRSPAADVAHGAAVADAEHAADKLLARTERRARDAAGSRAEFVATLDAALKADPAADSRVSRLRKLATLIEETLRSTSYGGALRLFKLDTATVTALRKAADTIDGLIVAQPPPQQIDRDSPQVNVAEGRLFFAMRPLWDDLAEAREDGTTALLLTVSPALLRGLNIRPDRKLAAAPAPKPAAPVM